MDLFTGEAEYIHRGLGAAILRQFFRDFVFVDSSVVSCIIGPEPENRVAIRAYEKVGFQHLKTIQVPDEPQPEYRMRLGRENAAAYLDQRIVDCEIVEGRDAPK